MSWLIGDADFSKLMRSYVLQLTAEHSCATPADWPNNHESIGMKGSVFLLPTVTPEDADKHFPEYHACSVPSGKDYLRLFPTEKLGKTLSHDANPRCYAFVFISFCTGTTSMLDCCSALPVDESIPMYHM